MDRYVLEGRRKRAERSCQWPSKADRERDQGTKGDSWRPVFEEGHTKKAKTLWKTSLETESWPCKPNWWKMWFGQAYEKSVMYFVFSALMYTTPKSHKKKLGGSRNMACGPSAQGDWGISWVWDAKNHCRTAKTTSEIHQPQEDP